jgi:hypothetical protein
MPSLRTGTETRGWLASRLRVPAQSGHSVGHSTRHHSARQDATRQTTHRTRAAGTTPTVTRQTPGKGLLIRKVQVRILPGAQKRRSAAWSACPCDVAGHAGHSFAIDRGNDGHAEAGVPRAIALSTGWQQRPPVATAEPAPLRYVGVRPIDRTPVDGPPSSATPGEIVEDGRFSRPCGPGAHSRASQKTNLRLRRHSHISAYCASDKPSTVIIQR